MLLAVLVFPLAINYYTPSWNAFLKQLPILGSSSSLIRWISVYIPVVIVVATLTVERVDTLHRHRLLLCVLGVAGVVVLGLSADRSFYEAEDYDPALMVSAFGRARAGTWEPRISYVGRSRDAEGRTHVMGGRNESLAFGTSQLRCYEPLFGYRLEDFPVRALHEGSVLDETEGVLNLKRPSCFVYPEENGCRPGDHFGVTMSEEATRFAAYRGVAFRFSRLQRVVNTLSLSSLSLSLALFCVIATRPRWSRTSGSSSRDGS